LYQFNDMSVGAGAGTATLSLQHAFYRTAPAPAFGNKLQDAGARIGDFDLVTDLGMRIGSGEWFRGLATCLALCYAAYSFAPTFEAVPAASPAPLGDAQYEEARALSITPLAFGGDTGRRMAATDVVAAAERRSVRRRSSRHAGARRQLRRVLERAGFGSGSRASGDGRDVVRDAGSSPARRWKSCLAAAQSGCRPLEALSFRARFDLKLPSRADRRQR
jgi:hypothetical protein